MEEIENAVNQEKRKILDLDLIEEKEGIQLILFKIIVKSMINYQFILIINIFEFILKNIVDHKIKTEKIKRDNLTNVKVNMIDEIKFILRLITSFLCKLKIFMYLIKLLKTYVYQRYL